MTDISVVSTGYQTERRSWLQQQPGAIGFGYTPSGTLDVSSFTPATHYPSGYIPSGTVLGRITATGLLGPFDAGASDGRQNAAGLLFSSTKVPNPADTTKDVGCAFLAAFAVVITSKLPFTSGAGALTSAARTALTTIYFEA